MYPEPSENPMKKCAKFLYSIPQMNTIKDCKYRVPHHSEIPNKCCIGS